ncbi:hypothetical protein [Bradyrhizobium sp. CCBAU 51627]|uniref:hypothetical protein n=1 Tax=Bradyrhizobium sp. CCBAU 51627 TaxID=1325088 RepID=UPI002306CDF5|nr:hypothetical protein [Bradyrhizobium sp. CCBAU 51627]MDA9435814.1 hypothetical protein [Bradyrhizobium sp. CCBAU 51627]
MRNILKQSSTLRRAIYWARMQRASSQSDEGSIIESLTTQAPKTFVEFGFHPVEFNCLQLARTDDWQGVLIDGNADQVADARRLLSKRIRAIQRFITLENIDFIKDLFPRLGVLSIDVDGNDYWFLERLIDTRPTVICVEYNSSFGLEPVTVPYHSDFDRHKYHPRGWYHGASITALASLCTKHGYGLAAVSSGGMNAVFTETGTLDPIKEWKSNSLRQRYSKMTQEEQWASVKTMPLINVQALQTR